MAIVSKATAGRAAGEESERASEAGEYMENRTRSKIFLLRYANRPTGLKFSQYTMREAVPSPESPAYTPINVSRESLVGDCWGGVLLQAGYHS